MQKFHKYKLLFDENMPKRLAFPRLNELFDIKHIRDDLQHAGFSDAQVYELAVELQRLIVTYNAKDFRRMAKESQDTGVIGVGALTPYHHIDNKLTALLTKSSQTALQGKYTPLSEAVA